MMRRLEAVQPVRTMERRRRDGFEFQWPTHGEWATLEAEDA